MTNDDGDDILEIDEIDRKILEILADDPRCSYVNIANELAKKDIEMSSESARRRVSSLLENMTSFFLPQPGKNDWEILLVAVWITDGKNARQQVFDAMANMNFWFVAYGIGTFDLYGIATVRSNTQIDELLMDIRELETVAKVDYFVETNRFVNIQNYIPVDDT